MMEALPTDDEQCAVAADASSVDVRANASGHNAPRLIGCVFNPATPTGHPAAIRTRSPHPLGHSVQDGLLHLDRAARRLRNPRPVLAPDRSVVQHLPRHRSGQQTCRGSRAPYQQISPCDLHCSPFIGDSPGSRPRHCAAGDNFSQSLIFMPSCGRAPQTRHRVSPDIAAVSADAIHFVHAHLVRLAIGRMTFRARQLGPLHVDGVREPDIRRLPRIHQPRRLMSGLDIAVHQDGFGLALANALGMASRTFLHCWKSGKGAVLADGMALGAVGDAGFFRVCLVKEIERLMLLRIEHARKYDPSDEQRDRHTESEDESVAPSLIARRSNPSWRRNAETSTPDLPATETAPLPARACHHRTRERVSHEFRGQPFPFVAPAMPPLADRK